MGYLQAMKDNFTEREIEYSSGVKLNRFTSDIVNIQDKAAQKLISNCPSISAANPFLAELARE